MDRAVRKKGNRQRGLSHDDDGGSNSHTDMVPRMPTARPAPRQKARRAMPARDFGRPGW